MTLLGLFVSVLLTQTPAQALTTCAPSSCTPQCGSSCTYYTCTRSKTMTLNLEALPADIQAPADACQFSYPGKVVSLPAQLGSVTLSRLPASPVLPYKACESQTLTGPLCP